MTLIVGCDPGLTGALALLCTRRGLLDLVDIPTAPTGNASGRQMRSVDVVGVRLLLANWAYIHEWARESVQGVIERPIAMPNMPSTTTASTFDTFGVLRYALPAAGVDLRIVNPREWKAVFGLGRDKEESRACALRLYPAAAVTRKKDHNRAEALLIAHFGSREWL